MNWKKHFREIILARGYDYFLDCCVDDLEISPERYTATVYGTEDYRVEIELDNGRISDMSCTCPYAEDGNNCKHMAAVLFAAEKRNDRTKFESKPEQEEKELQELKELLDSVSQEQLKQFFLEQTQGNEALRQTFKLCFAEKVSEGDLNRFKQMIRQIFITYAYDHKQHYDFDYYGDDDEFEDYENYDDYDGNPELIDKIREFIDGYIEIMLEKQEYEPAFLLISEIALVLDEYNLKKYDYVCGEISDVCHRYWSFILDTICDASLERKIFEWLQEKMFDSAATGHKMLDLYFSHFPEKEYLLRKLDVADQKLQLLADREKQYYSEQELTRWVQIKLEIMRSLGTDEMSCRKVEELYWRLTGIRKSVSDRCLGSGDIGEAIRILDESRRLDAEKPGLIINYSRQIRDLYRELGDLNNCKKEARCILQSTHHDFLDDFLEWKALCAPEEWESEREQVFALMKNKSLLRELYREEKLYVRLMNSLMESASWELPKYENVLKPLYPGEILAWYEHDVRQRAENTGKREHYKQLGDTLLHMREYPNGGERVDAIACEWKTVYKKRRAMMEELHKKGL